MLGAIFSFNKNKALGIDEVDHQILCNIFKSQGSLLINVYNYLLKLKYFPDSWKISETVYFQKARKQPTESSSSRLLSLLLFLGKIFQKLILRRINYIFNTKKDNFPSQHGSIEESPTVLQMLFLQLELL